MKNKLVPWKKRDDALDFRRDEHPFDRLHREIDELFESYHRGFGNLGRRFAAAPGFEVSETDDEIRIKAELPGIDEKDIEVSLDENVLTIRAERQDEHEEKKRNYQVSEMSYGRFQRSVPLRTAVDRDRAKAGFERGVLTLVLPKTEQAKAERKQIPISAD